MAGSDLNEASTHGSFLPYPRLVSRLLWLLLGLVLLSLFVLAGVLLLRMDVLTSEKLTDDQTTSVWAFLGVAVGAVITLIGTLLTEQHNRRTAILAGASAEQERIARERDHQLAKENAARLEMDRLRQRDAAQEAETRLKLDTVARVLDLITVDGTDAYAPKARVAGAVATMMELGGGTVATRILGQLWAENAIDARTAVWLVDRILEDPAAKPAETISAAAILSENAHALLPSVDDPNQDWIHWPHVLDWNWPTELPRDARNHLMIMTCKAMLLRSPQYWADHVEYPRSTLNRAVADPEYGDMAALVLREMIDRGVLDPVEMWGAEEADESVDIIRDVAADAAPSQWFKDVILTGLHAWAADEDARGVPETQSPSVVARGDNADSLREVFRTEAERGERQQDSTPR